MTSTNHVLWVNWWRPAGGRDGLSASRRRVEVVGRRPTARSRRHGCRRTPHPPHGGGEEGERGHSGVLRLAGALPEAEGEGVAGLVVLAAGRRPALAGAERLHELEVLVRVRAEVVG